MRIAGLEMPFSELFANALERYQLTGAAGDIAVTMKLLSPDYAEAAEIPELPALPRILAGSKASLPAPKDTRGAALVAGLDPANARQDLIDMASNNRMGEAILRCLILLDLGASGDPVALTQALATLQAFGLEDTARRAALQILLLERYS